MGESQGLEKFEKELTRASSLRLEENGLVSHAIPVPDFPVSLIDGSGSLFSGYKKGEEVLINYGIYTSAFGGAPDLAYMITL
jgi:hypothetical protein